MAISQPDNVSEAPRSDAVAVGRIVGAWGLRGHLKVEPLTDFSERFSPGSVVYLNGRIARVTAVRKSKSILMVKLDLVGDRSQAESLRGEFLTVRQDDLKPLPEGSYYHFQIIGIDVWTEGGDHLGHVTEILATGSNDVYVVQDDGKTEVLVPALASVVVEINLNAERMVVRLPDGLR